MVTVVSIHLCLPEIPRRTFFCALFRADGWEDLLPPGAAAGVPDAAGGVGGGDHGHRKLRRRLAGTGRTSPLGGGGPRSRAVPPGGLPASRMGIYRPAMPELAGFLARPTVKGSAESGRPPISHGTAPCHVPATPVPLAPCADARPMAAYTHAQVRLAQRPNAKRGKARLTRALPRFRRQRRQFRYFAAKLAATSLANFSTNRLSAAARLA